MSRYENILATQQQINKLNRPSKKEKMQEKKLIVFTGDDPKDFTVYSSRLGEKYEIKFCGCLPSGRMQIQEQNGEISLVIIMWNFINFNDGEAVMKMIRENCPITPVIIITENKQIELAVRMLHPEGLLHKPFNLQKLDDMVANLMSDHLIYA